MGSWRTVVGALYNLYMAITTRRIFFLLILWLAFGLRFYGLADQSFWNDEGNSARLSERSLALIIEGTASDVHPPLYYVMLRGWRELVGEHEFGLRSLSALAGVLVVAVTMGLGRQLTIDNCQLSIVNCKKGYWLVGLAGFLTAVSPPLIYYSQETRMYSLLGLWAVLATWLLLRLETRDWRLETGRWQLTIDHWQLTILYVLTLAAGLYTHYFFPAIIVVHGFIVLTSDIRNTQYAIRNTLRWLPYPFAALLLYAPWLPIFLRQTGGRPESDISFLQFLQQAGHWLAFGETAPVGWGLWLVVGLVLIGVWNGRSRTIIPLIATIIPLLFMFAAGSIAPQYFKFLVTAVPFLCLLIGFTIYDLQGRSRCEATFTIWRVAIYGSLITGYCLLITSSLTNLYTNPDYARADYRGMAARIEAVGHPNAGIILDAPNQWEVFTYYHREGAPVYPLPTGVSQPTAEDIDGRLSEIAGQHTRLYAIFWGETQRDPERLVERWLDEHAFKATDEWVGDVRFVTYAVPDEGATEMETAVSLPFGDHITLEGYTLNSEQFQRGDIVQVTLFWQTAVPLDQRYKIFLHLVDAGGQPIAQRDSEPGGGLNLTTVWQPGKMIVDNHGLLIPANAPPGEYRVLLGLYDVADPTARLPITTAAGVQDAVTLVTFELRN